MYRIDFYPCCHGNFLELLVNTFVLGQPLPNVQTQADEIGRIHIKNADPLYVKSRLIEGAHYGLNSIEISDPGPTIRVKVSAEDMLIVQVNLATRCPDPFTIQDLETIEIDTERKFRSNAGIKHIQERYGISQNYRRQDIREWWKFKFDYPVYGIDQINRFSSQVTDTIDFNFRAFYNYDYLIQELESIAQWTGNELNISEDLKKLWNEFISKNQGWHCYSRTSQLLDELTNQSHLNFGTLTIIEEAWILHQTKIENTMEKFPVDTLSLLSFSTLND